ncbi:MAG: hypothetical protein ACE5MI_04205 [Acidimicrobiia bacterium]
METRVHVMTWLIAGSVALAAVIGHSPDLRPTFLGQETESSQAPIPNLSEGERFDHQDWSLAVQSSFAVPSATRFAYTEVRADVALQNLTPSELIYYSTSLAGDQGYPEMVLRDAAGTTHPLNLARFSSTAAGSTLVAQPAAVPARWILGYQIPTAFASDLELIAVWDGAPVASWNLTGAGTDFFEGWTPPAQLLEARWGQDIAWSENLVATPLGHDLEVCGNAESERVVGVYGLVLQVRNEGTTDALWTGVRYPEDAAIAIWPDGASARNGGLRFGETFVSDAGETQDPLGGLGPEARIIPPQVTALRMLGFSLPRDSRFSSPFALPQTVVLYPPAGSSVWLETSGEQLIDFTVPAEVCGEVAAASGFDVAAPAP